MVFNNTVGDSWWNFIRDSKKFRSEAQAGLGRGFSCNQWAVETGIVDLDGKFIADREECIRKARELKGDDNALDCRAA